MRLLILLLAGTALRAYASDSLEIPTAKGGSVRLFSAPTTVLIFTRTDCPISNRYAPEVRRLSDRFGSKNTAFYLVYVDPRQTESAVREHLREFQYPMEGLLDRRHQLVKLAHATITPEAAVFINGQLVYHGRIDDRYVTFGQARPAARVHDLEEILVSIAGGNRPAYRETRSVGCYIEDLK